MDYYRSFRELTELTKMMRALHIPFEYSERVDSKYFFGAQAIVSQFEVIIFKTC